MRGSMRASPTCKEKRQVGKAGPVGDIVLRGHAGVASGRVAGLAELGKDWMGPSRKTLSLNHEKATDEAYGSLVGVL